MGGWTETSSEVIVRLQREAAIKDALIAELRKIIVDAIKGGKS